MDSSAFDLLFWSEVLRQRKEKKIDEVVDSLQEKCAGLIDDIGFGLYVREMNNYKVKNLVTERRIPGANRLVFWQLGPPVVAGLDNMSLFRSIPSVYIH